MSNVSVFKTAGLPAVSSLSSSLKALTVASAAAGGGVAILKMDKIGCWVFGADATEVEDGSKWAVNPFSFVHGFIAWGNREVLGEKMVGVSQPLPELDPAPAGAEKGWETQLGMSLKCISGEDSGLEVRYVTTSLGGKRAVQELAVALSEQVDKDQTKPVPVVTLNRGSYPHKNYGKVLIPVFDIVEFISLDGEAEEAPKAGRRRRIAA